MHCRACVMPADRNVATRLLCSSTVQASPELVEPTEARAAHSTAAVWQRIIHRAADRFGTPCYITRWSPIAQRAAALAELGGSTVPVRSWLSFKTHPMPALVRTWLGTGRGV